MDCIIRITKGPEQGQEFRCTGKETVIGRSQRSQVRLSSPTVSFEHAVISRDHENFLIENLSANGTFVNDDRITGKVRLRVKDQLRFGQDTAARVEALPASVGANARRNLLIFGGGASVAITILLLALAPFLAKPEPGNYSDAYPKLEAYVQKLVETKAVSNQTLHLLQEAWRLEMARDRANSGPTWRDLNILLASQEADMGYRKALSDNPNAINKLRTRGGPEPTDDEKKAALVQFVTRYAQTSK